MATTGLSSLVFLSLSCIFISFRIVDLIVGPAPIISNDLLPFWASLWPSLPLFLMIYCHMRPYCGPHPRFYFSLSPSSPSTASPWMVSSFMTSLTSGKKSTMSLYFSAASLALRDDRVGLVPAEHLVHHRNEDRLGRIHPEVHACVLPEYISMSLLITSEPLECSTVLLILHDSASFWYISTASISPSERF